MDDSISELLVKLRAVNKDTKEKLIIIFKAEVDSMLCDSVYTHRIDESNGVLGESRPYRLYCDSNLSANPISVSCYKFDVIEAFTEDGVMVGAMSPFKLVDMPVEDLATVLVKLLEFKKENNL